MCYVLANRVFVVFEKICQLSFSSLLDFCFATFSLYQFFGIAVSALMEAWLWYPSKGYFSLLLFINKLSDFSCSFSRDNLNNNYPR